MTHDLASLSKIIDAAFEDRAAIDTTTPVKSGTRSRKL